MEKVICFVFFAAFIFCNLQKVERVPDVSKTAYRLVWGDEFDEIGLPDSAKWGYDTGGSGWGNNELQYYSDRRSENARVENGKLIIEARKEEYKRKDYTSARLVTKKKGEWCYGRMEIRAKLPRGRGTWPAIWMLSAQQEYGLWPASGEIDIMEHVGFDPGKIHGAVHTKKFNHMIQTQKTGKILAGDASDTFHEYSVEWTPESILFFVDGKNYFRFDNDHTSWESWPFDQPFYLILNIAIGGNWGGQKGVDDTILPQKMEIDYVRIYEK
ncbi:MAG: glycoside hydrolase family 16 protein [Saprospiraceae bacterium]|nr:glycoside hydrolase family 16 protein [Saprospiraceae bacterium]